MPVARPIAIDPFDCVSSKVEFDVKPKMITPRGRDDITSQDGGPRGSEAII